jgi:hypothetical protein
MSYHASSGSSQWVLSTTEGGCHFRWRRSPAGVLAEWVGILVLRLDAAGRVSYEPATGADPRLVDKLTHTGAAAFVRALRQQPSLHASAVAASGRALVCLGEKGSGKSTAAAELCRTPGVELLADDVAALDRERGVWRVLPTESAHWLAAAGGHLKGPVSAAAVGSDAAPLSTLVAVRFDDGAPAPRARRLRGAEAYATLSAALLRFEATDLLRVQELDVLSSIAAQARVFELVRGHSTGAAETARLALQLMGDVA